MKILFFNELSENQVKQIAEINFNHWKKFNSALDYEHSTSGILGMHKNVNNLPLGIAVIESNEIAGFCTLRTDRLQNHLDINPWVCNLLVLEKYRGKGYAKVLLNAACEKYQALGYKKIYAWTDQIPDLFKKFGWQFEGEITKNEGGKGLLFSKML